MLLPLGIVILASIAYVKSNKKAPVMTAERKSVYDSALKYEKDPAKLAALAVAFKREGLDAEAAMLEKRAKLRSLPPDVKKARNEAFKKGLKSTDVNKVKQLASAFQKEGATGAAAELKTYAKTLEASQVVDAAKEG